VGRIRLPVLILFAFAASLALIGSADTQRSARLSKPPQPEKPEIMRERSEWFYSQRAYPHKYVPAGARLNALRELDLMTASGLALGLAPTSNPSWTLIGPKPIKTPYTDPIVAGRVSALAVDPGNPSVVYAGAAQGGIWKTTTAGSSWSPLTDRQASLAIGSVALDPTNSNIVYVGTGEENFAGDSYYGAGILKSTNGGTTWTHLCGPFCGPVGQDGFYGGGARIGALAISPANNQVILAAVALLRKDGIYRSADGGKTWTQVVSGNPGTAVLFDPVNGNTAYAALGNSFSGGTESVFKSTDGGQTWSADNGSGGNVLPIANAGRIVLAMDPSHTATLYAGIANVSTGSLLGLFKSTDGGGSWTRLTSTPDYCTPQCWYDHTIAVDPANSNVIYAGGAFSTTLIRSLDGGSSWTVLQAAANFGFLHADMHALAFASDGSKLYLGNDGGVYSTTQTTATNPAFTALNSTLATAQFYPRLSIDPTNVAKAIGGTQDNGTDLYSGGLAWNDVVCGDGAATAIDTAVPTTMYAACENIDIEKSTTGGAAGSWNQVINGIDTGDRVEFIPPLVIDASQPANLYFGTYRLYQTTNGAANWTAISGDLTSGPSFWGVVTGIAVAPRDSNTVYVGTGDSHVWVTTNALSGTGATFANRSSTSLPPRVITDIAVDPATSTTAYVVFSGFKGFGDTKGHVFRTIDGGAHWKDISGNLPNTPVNAIVINPSSPSEIFVGTDIGVFYTTSGGVSWATLNVGLPHVAVLGLALHSASNRLRAATHGRSVWDLNISTVLSIADITSISPSSANHGGPAFTLTVNGGGFDSTSVVRWHNSALTTTFVSTTQLRAAVPAADITNPGTATVTVFDSSTNMVSNGVAFTIK
jgi:photosystem II stability/assembly factor-like uncharacterized protein